MNHIVALIAIAATAAVAIYTVVTSYSQETPHQNAPPRRRKKIRKPLRTKLYNDMLNGECKCFICPIPLHNAKIYACKSCYNIACLSCIKTWAAVQMKDSARWHCPICNVSNSTSPSQIKYTCYCGRLEAPSLGDHLHVAHSCRSICLRCDDECHPGPCDLWV